MAKKKENEESNAAAAAGIGEETGTAAGTGEETGTAAQSSSATEGGSRSEAGSDATSFDRIVDGLQRQIRKLQEDIARKEDNHDKLSSQLSSMEAIVKRLADMRQPPQLEKGESLLDAVVRTLGIDHLWK